MRDRSTAHRLICRQTGRPQRAKPEDVGVDGSSPGDETEWLDGNPVIPGQSVGWGRFFSDGAMTCLVLAWRRSFVLRPKAWAQGSARWPAQHDPGTHAGRRRDGRGARADYLGDGLVRQGFSIRSLPHSMAASSSHAAMPSAVEEHQRADLVVGARSRVRQVPATGTHATTGLAATGGEIVAAQARGPTTAPWRSRARERGRSSIATARRSASPHAHAAENDLASLLGEEDDLDAAHDSAPPRTARLPDHPEQDDAPLWGSSSRAPVRRTARAPRRRAT